METMKGEAVTMGFVGVPHKFITCYGSYLENIQYLGLTVTDIQKKLKSMI
jgi:hypothetical protein